ncbi:MAG: DNA mismatch repair protein MutS [Chloroflexi bacterium]|nr:DNA mismatch repair protein MutS [Chloroflexota bacterium]
MERESSKGEPGRATPIWRQYQRVKRRYPDCILLFRMGDFYETFGEDARVAAHELQITLTGRPLGKGHREPMAGIPYHALEGYLARLIRAGHRVAICEQLSDPAASKGLVERDVIRVVTPGTVTEPALLEQKANNYLAAVVASGLEAGLAYADITTAEFATTQLPLAQLPLELERLAPAEVLAVEELKGALALPRVTALPSHLFDLALARDVLLEHFGVASLEGYGCEGLPLAVRAAGAILQYLKETQKGFLGRLTSLRTYSTGQFMALDPQTRRNLELFQGGRSGSGPSLFSVLDFTRTPMGGRLLRRWLGQPLLDIISLQQRQEAVAWLHASSLRREAVATLLREVPDLERLINRVGAGTAMPRDLLALRRGLEAVPKVLALLAEGAEAVAWLTGQVKPCAEVVALIASAIEEEPSTAVGEGGVIRVGFSTELDELRQAGRSAREYLAGLERQERERSGISTLKVGYNKVFGYFIEVSKANLSKVPPDYIRRQTLTGAERFITPDLKEYEALILNAQERLAELEGTLFRQVCRQVAQSAERVLATAEGLAQVDVFYSLAEAAARHGYVRPVLNGGDTIEIHGGRHPIVERALPAGSFVPNDTTLSNSGCQVLVLTGPNMSGKSTYIRQVALLVLMAQVGSFVPAESAQVGLVDRIFTRVGLQDDLTTGQSTFMVEMLETAQILNHATPRSLVIVDEIGRGTSTYDGMAIARAVVEHLHNHPKLGCKALFATHYHELTRLADYLPRVRNCNVAVVEEGNRVVFLHRIVPGGADRSYGVHVAQLAGLPPPVIHRAWELLRELEASAPGAGRGARSGRRAAAHQLPLLQGAGDGTLQELLAALLKLDLNTLSPLEALNRLFDLQQKAREAGSSHKL